MQRVYKNGESRRLTRNVSPMIQAGVELPSSKNAPIHMLPEASVIIKSAELMLQLLPPNESVTFTLVLQATRLPLVINVHLGG